MLLAFKIWLSLRLILWADAILGFNLFNLGEIEYCFHRFRDRKTRLAYQNHVGWTLALGRKPLSFVEFVSSFIMKVPNEPL